MGEAVIKQLPMVLTDIQPGHEEENLRFLLKHNIVEYGRVPREVVFMVEEFLDGKRRIDWDKSFDTIVKPPGSVSAVEALKNMRLVTLVKHYQQDVVPELT
jgi:hypothetical protein